MKAIRIALFALLAAGAALAQTYGLSGAFQQIYFSTSGTYPGAGLPLANGFLYTCVAGAACPGTPQATYTDSTGTTTNANPVTLSANGTPTNGSSPVGVWLNCSLNYKMVLQDQNNVTVQVTDNVSCTSSGSGGGGTNYWTLSGSTITNNNGAGAGPVNIGGSLNAGNGLTVTGTVGFADSQATPTYAYLRAPDTMTTTTTWRLPAADAAGCLESDGAGKLSFVACSGGGGGGSAAGPLTAIQFNNPLGTLDGDSGLTYAGTGGTVQLSGTGSFMTVGTNSGFDASTCTATNCVQALSGGLNGKWLISTDSLFFVEEAAPSASSSGQTRIYSDSTLHWPQLSANTGSYLPLAVSGAFSSFTNGHCVSASISGGQLSFVDAGGACTTGGYGGTVSSSAIGNIGYYSGATTIAGSADNTWNNSTQQATITGTSNSIAALTVLTGFIQTAGGLAVPSANTSTAAINALGGGVTSKWLIANDSLFLIAESQPSVSASGQARLYLDSTSFTINASINGGAYAPFGGGGGGSPIGPNTAIQFNNSGSFGGSANLLWVAGQDLVVTGVASTQTLWAKNGYLRADGGLIASSSCTNYNCIQSESAAGGMAARSFTATTYTKIGNSTGAPTLSTGDSLSAGVFYWDNGAGAAKIYNGSSYLTLATGGISSLNSLTGALNIVGTTNEITVTPSGTSITLATPQAIATTSNVTFNNVTATGSNSFISTTTGTNYALVVNGGTMLIQGNGQWSSSGAAAINGTSGSLNLPSATAINSVQTSGGVNVNSTGSGNGGYQVTGSTVINSSGQWVGGAVLANGNVQTTGVYAVSGGYFGISHNVTIGSCTMYFQGGILYSTSGGC